MSNMQIRWILAGALLSALAGCDVVDCDKKPDADICQDDEEEDAGEPEDEDDAGKPLDGGADAGKDAGNNPDAGKDAGKDSGTPSGDASSDGGADAATSNRLTIPEFCTAQLASALAWRDAFDSCCPSAKPADVTTFLRDSARYVEDAEGVCEMLRNGPIDAKKSTYDDTKAAACAEAYVKAYEAPPTECPAAGFDLEILEGMIGHGAPALAQIPACREAFKGLTKQGDPCTDQLECAAGLRCAGEAGDKTCEKVVTSGGTCFGNAECGDGLTCVGNAASGGKQCREPAGSTGKCAASSECEAGLVCRATGTNPTQCVVAKASTPVCK